MNKKRVLSLVSWIFISFLFVISYSQITPTKISPASAQSAQPVALTVSAAASLQNAMKDIKSLYSKATLNFNFGSSGALQQQIEQGAPVDVFISAAPKQMDALQQKGLVLTETRKNLLKNEVVLIAPKDSSTVSNFQDLTSDKVQKIAIGQPTSVPAGKYAQQVLTSLNLFAQLQPKLVFAKDVRQVLSYVETGNADAGIVYTTDAKISNKVKIVATAPPNSHSPVVYPVAVLKDSKNIEAAKQFVQFLFSPQATTVFEKYGFSKSS